MQTSKFTFTLNIFTFFIVLFATSCGYKFQGSGTVLPSDIKKIAIPLVENDSSESGLTQKLTEELKSRFERYGVVKVVDKTSEADAILNVLIKDVRTRVSSVSSSDIAVGSDIIMTVSATLKRKNGQLLYANDRFTVSEPIADISGLVVTSSPGFTGSGIGAGSLSGITDLEVSRGQKEQAFSAMTEEIGRLIYLDAVAADF